MPYVESTCRQALTRVKGMPFAWSLNPYRGCHHACLYCYARLYHSYLGFDDPADFDRTILTKENLAVALERDLGGRRHLPQGEVAVGTATDPYQPIEARKKLTRKALEVLLRYGIAVSITTKSPLVLRDLDLLEAFAAYGGMRVNITVTALSETSHRLLEPLTATPRARLAALAKLKAAGIPVTLFVAPVIPYIGPGEAAAVLRLAAEAGVDHAMLSILRLSPGVGEWLLPRLEAHCPRETALIRSLYGRGEVPPKGQSEAVMAPLRALRRQLGLDVPPPALHRRERQLALFNG